MFSYRTGPFLVVFFSATIDGRNLIFGHKLYIGTPYRGSLFAGGIIIHWYRFERGTIVYPVLFKKVCNSFK
jgi:hypothetical protein